MYDKAISLKREFLYQVMRTIRFIAQLAYYPMVIAMAILIVVSLSDLVQLMGFYGIALSKAMGDTKEIRYFIYDLNLYVSTPEILWTIFFSRFKWTVLSVFVVTSCFAISTPYMEKPNMPTNKIRTCRHCGGSLPPSVFLRCQTCKGIFPSGLMLALIRSYGYSLSIVSFFLMITISLFLL